MCIRDRGDSGRKRVDKYKEEELLLQDEEIPRCGGDEIPICIATGKVTEEPTMVVAERTVLITELKGAPDETQP